MVIKPFLIPIFLCIILRTGAKQFVVQLAALTITSSFVKTLSLTPYTTVFISPLPGALISTFLAPAEICFIASSLAVNLPVHSRTKSIPSSPQGKFAGSVSLNTLILLTPATTISLPSALISSSWKLPWTVSYLTK